MTNDEVLRAMYRLQAAKVELEFAQEHYDEVMAKASENQKSKARKTLAESSDR